MVVLEQLVADPIPGAVLHIVVGGAPVPLSRGRVPDELDDRVTQRAGVLGCPQVPVATGG